MIDDKITNYCDRLRFLIFKDNLKSESPKGDQIMNFRLVLFSGLVTALVGAGIGYGISRIERSPSQVNYKNPHHYQLIYGRYFAATGAGIGFFVGAGLQMVKELKEERDREMGIDSSEF
jgi:hypothetical protein